MQRIENGVKMGMWVKGVLHRIQPWLEDIRRWAIQGHYRYSVSRILNAETFLTNTKQMRSYSKLKIPLNIIQSGISSQHSLWGSRETQSADLVGQSSVVWHRVNYWCRMQFMMVCTYWINWLSNNLIRLLSDWLRLCNLLELLEGRG